MLAGYGGAGMPKKYVSPRVLQQCLNYVNTAVAHALTWKVMKDHMNALLENVVLPIMSFNEDDQDLWETDPYEYVRVKFDIFEDFVRYSTHLDRDQMESDLSAAPGFQICHQDPLYLSSHLISLQANINSPFRACPNPDLIHTPDAGQLKGLLMLAYILL